MYTHFESKKLSLNNLLLQGYPVLCGKHLNVLLTNWNLYVIWYLYKKISLVCPWLICTYLLDYESQNKPQKSIFVTVHVQHKLWRELKLVAYPLPLKTCQFNVQSRELKVNIHLHLYCTYSFMSHFSKDYLFLGRSNKCSYLIGSLVFQLQKVCFRSRWMI